jgi:uncharacterized FAD-dependent dehydrogenase
MRKSFQIKVLPEIAAKEYLLKQFISNEFEIDIDQITSVQIHKRSIDARSKQAMIFLDLTIFINEFQAEKRIYAKEYPYVKNKPEVIIVGCGPAGMFAALRLIELGIKPIIIERGKDVRSRRRDLAAINKERIVNPDSNYCFGEGGAGTYSDGKLYTRSNKRGNLRKILEVLVAHGAMEDILIDTHPHIGTNKLPLLVSSIRETIIKSGGVVLFESRVEDFIISNNTLKGVIIQDGTKIEGLAVILATGHSARDIFSLLYKRKILIESKPFALGLRIEHPQTLIDSIQYHCKIRSEFLPAASYALVEQVKNRGVFSFCMCPGGFVVPAATSFGEVVVNGMSPSKRDSKFANSGIVVAVEATDYKQFHSYGPLAGIKFQQEIEQKAFVYGGKNLSAPAQRLCDFTENKFSSSLPQTSYQPGITPVQLNHVLPNEISNRLQYAFKSFGKKMKGYYTNEAALIGVESRTSSPVKIPRNKNTLQHPQIKNLYPCGEGAGYAGGIISAAMDGERCAEMCVEEL